MAVLDGSSTMHRKFFITLNRSKETLAFPRPETTAMIAEDNTLGRRPELSSKKRELLEKWLRGEFKSLTDERAITRRDGRNRTPLSFAQQRLWFFSQLEPSSPLYNMPAILRLKGKLQREALQKSLNAIVSRHESLRTHVAIDSDGPVQAIDLPANVSVPFEWIDLGGHSKFERDEELGRALARESRKPFDLTRDCLLRSMLVRLDEEEHVLHLSMHHIASDGWSWGVFFRELSLYYESFSQGRASELPELPVQYADFAIWQRQWLQGPTLEKQVDYWKNRLANAPDFLELPADFSRPPTQTFQGQRQSLVLSPQLSAALKALSLREDATLFMTLLAAFKTLIWRYTRQEDFLIGCPVAGRTDLETEPLIGFFINTLVLRTNLSGNPTFLELLRRVNTGTLEAYRNQDLPFEKLVEALKPDRSPSYSPLVQAMFVIRNAISKEIKLSGLDVSLLEASTGTSKFDLTLSVDVREEGLTISMEYNTDLFGAARITRMLGHYRNLLEGIVANPAARLAELPILPRDERDRVLEQWNQNQTEFPDRKRLDQLFEEQAERSPNSIAIIDGQPIANKARNGGCDMLDAHQSSSPHSQNGHGIVSKLNGEQTGYAQEVSSISYQELNRRSNQLARYLRRLGVGTETLVGICMDRSIEMVIGMLSVLKAGGAYVPLDPALPKDRLAFMIQDARMPVLLTQTKHLNSLPNCAGAEESNRALASRIEFSNGSSANAIWTTTSESSDENASPSTRIVTFEKDGKAISTEAGENLASRHGSQNLAYVIYTSGTTGRPKGVAIEHRSIVNHLCWRQRAFPLTSEDRFLQKASSSFDISVWEIFGPLIAGAELVLAKPGGEQDAAYLVRQMAGHQVTHAHFGPAMLRLILEEKEFPRCDSLRRVFCGGEPLTAELQSRFFERCAAELLSQYGPTETTVDVTFCKCSSMPGIRPAPIGRPISNTRAYILDQHYQPVPIGITGELFIGGAGVARGYLNQPTLTAQKFCPDPFSDEPRARLFRTGDLCRYRADGNIEFLGRIDHQVKIRGFRIEPDEVRAALNQHPAVRDCAVIAREGPSGGQRLVAYVVPASNRMKRPTDAADLIPLPSGRSRLDSGDVRPAQSLIPQLRRHLEETLPEYMIPGVFTILERLPLSHTGKLDRRALPVPEIGRATLDEAYTAPRTAAEEALCEMWSTLLGNQQIGVNDDFFELGGHSLLAIQVLSRIRQVFQVDLPMTALFEHTTVATLASLIAEMLTTEIDAISEDEAQRFAKSA